MWFSAIADKEEEGPVDDGNNIDPNTSYATAAALASLISPSSTGSGSGASFFSAAAKLAAISKAQSHSQVVAAGEEESTLPPIHFVSRRSPIYCTKACVATSQPLATSIGLHILRGCGGNAADASVAIAAALAVVSRMSGVS